MLLYIELTADFFYAALARQARKVATRLNATTPAFKASASTQK